MISRPVEQEKAWGLQGKFLLFRHLSGNRAKVQLSTSPPLHENDFHDALANIGT